MLLRFSCLFSTKVNRDSIAVGHRNVRCDSRHPILQTASDLIEIERRLSPVVSTGRCNICAEEEGEA